MTRPRVLNPREVPVVGTDVHLHPVPQSALSAAALRERFGRAGAWRAELEGDDAHPPATTPARLAAVLVPLVLRERGLQVLLTRRTDHLRDHAGQISFPGGRCEPGDDGPAATALREAEEEVGLPRDRVEILGQLPPYTTVTRYAVTPVVALVRPPFELTLDSGEVAEAFEVPLAHLMDPAQHHRHLFSFDGGQRHFLSMPWQGQAADGQAREYFIWGATAAMLRNLYRFLAE
jgi:8-oxo-dGTP pyrophosphatase MutT (NUDIX family)